MRFTAPELLSAGSSAQAGCDAADKVREASCKTWFWSGKCQNQANRHHGDNQRVLDDLGAFFVFGKRADGIVHGVEKFVHFDTH